jgi:glycosyltransferase involved in cell wall biosynthesis
MQTRKKIKVTYFFRKPFKDYFSIEHLFGFIRSALPDYVEHTSYFLKRMSTGLINRILICFEVVGKQNEVNHITGDVHFISFLMKKNRTVLTIHDLEVLKRLKGVKRFIVKLFWFTLPVMRVRYVTMISEFTKQEFLKVVRVNPDKVVVIYDCVSPDIKPFPAAFNASKPNILHIGTAHNKNLERLIEAIDGMSVTLTVVGRLRDHHKVLLDKYKTDYQNFVNLPYAEVIQRYEEANIVSFVSLYEGFGLPIIEAQSVGRPVITSNVTSMPEVAGDSALLVDPEDVEQIRKGIQNLIKDEKLRKDLVKKGFENVKRFTPKAIAQQYADLYEKMVK